MEICCLRVLKIVILLLYTLRSGVRPTDTRGACARWFWFGHCSARRRRNATVPVANAGSSVKKTMGHYRCYRTLLDELLYPVLIWLLWPREVCSTISTAGTVQCLNRRNLLNCWSVGTEVCFDFFVFCVLLWNKVSKRSNSFCFRVRVMIFRAAILASEHCFFRVNFWFLLFFFSWFTKNASWCRSLGLNFQRCLCRKDSKTLEKKNTKCVNSWSSLNPL